MKSICLVAIVLCSYAISATHGALKCKNVYNCLVAPCSISTCPAYPNAKCKDNYCGGCFADYYVAGVKVNCSDCNTVNCFVAPCSVSKCVAYPNAKCVDNYCNGCFADYYVDGVKVDCSLTNII